MYMEKLGEKDHVMMLLISQETMNYELPLDTSDSERRCGD